MSNRIQIPQEQGNSRDVLNIEDNKLTFRNNDNNEVMSSKERNEQQLSQMSSICCWLCGEVEGNGNEFASICKCAGSNKIHSHCLINVTLEDLKKRKMEIKGIWKKQIRNHECSICKANYRSVHIGQFYFDCRATLQAFCFHLFGWGILTSGVIMSIVTYYVLQEKGSNSKKSEEVSDVYNNMIIFLGSLAAFVSICLYLTGFIIFYKGFVKRRIQGVYLEMITGATKLYFKYHPFKEQYTLELINDKKITKMSDLNNPQNIQKSSFHPQTRIAPHIKSSVLASSNVLAVIPSGRIANHSQPTNLQFSQIRVPFQEGINLPLASQVFVDDFNMFTVHNE